MCLISYIKDIMIREFECTNRASGHEAGRTMLVDKLRWVEKGGTHSASQLHGSELIGTSQGFLVRKRLVFYLHSPDDTTACTETAEEALTLGKPMGHQHHVKRGKY